VQVRFRSEAVEDVEVARAWYNEQRDDLGNDFVVALESAIRLVVEFPEAFPEIAAPRFRSSESGSVGSVLYVVEPLEVRVLSPDRRVMGPGSGQDDAIRESDPEIGAQIGCGDGQVRIQVHDQSSSHLRDRSQCELGVTLHTDPLEDLE
jgi:hypothetical protein